MEVVLPDPFRGMGTGDEKLYGDATVRHVSSSGPEIKDRSRAKHNATKSSDMS